MTLGIVMIVHTALGRAAEAANHWAKHGCPVVIHVDKRVPAKDLTALKQRLAAHQTIRFCATPYKCDLGYLVVGGGIAKRV